MTEAEIRSAMTALTPLLVALPIPAVSIAQADIQESLNTWRGILAGATVLIPLIYWTLNFYKEDNEYSLNKEDNEYSLKTG